MSRFAPLCMAIAFLFVCDPSWGANFERKSDDQCDDAESSYLGVSIDFRSASRKYPSYWCSDFWLNKGELGIITVKPQNSRVDPDVMISAYNKSEYVNKRTSSGSHNEIIIFGTPSEGNWYNIVASDYSGRGGGVDVFIHVLDIEEVFWEGMAYAGGQYVLEEILCGLFTDKSCSDLGDTSVAVAGRAATLGLAALQDASINNMTKTAAYTEVMSLINSKIGLNREMSIIVSNVVKAFLDRIYENY